MENLILAVDFALGYLLGSIPFGLLLTKIAGQGDIRAIGSGNIGATNVLRTGNKPLAAATLLLDMLKGTAAVLIARYLARGTPNMEWAGMIAGFGAFVGHVFPIWLKFKGGKGVATFLGVMLGLVWQAMLITALVWIATAAIFRFSSLAALVATAASPVLIWYFGYPLVALMFVVLALIVWIKHHENISRLLAGTESKIGGKK
jgi:acyl phosphate:glycerol-3-phosphate acyltransferase